MVLGFPHSVPVLTGRAQPIEGSEQKGQKDTLPFLLSHLSSSYKHILINENCGKNLRKLKYAAKLLSSASDYLALKSDLPL